MAMKINFRKIAILTLILLVVLWILYFLRGIFQDAFQTASNSNKLDSLTMEKMRSEIDDETSRLEKVILRVPGQSAGCYWNVNLNKMVEKDNVAKMYAVDAHYFNELGEELYHLTSLTGETYWETGKMHFSEEVKFKTATGRKLSSDELFWDPQTGIIANGNVLAEYEDTVVSTEKLTSNADLDQSQFFGETHVVSQGNKQ